MAIVELDDITCLIVVLIVCDLGLEIPRRSSLSSDSIGDVDPSLGTDSIEMSRSAYERQSLCAHHIMFPLLRSALDSSLSRGPIEPRANCSTTFCHSQIIEAGIALGPPSIGYGHFLRPT